VPKVPGVLRVLKVLKVLFVLLVNVFKTLGTLGTPNSRHLKKGKLLISHRYNCLPLLPSGPGGVQQELVV